MWCVGIFFLEGSFLSQASKLYDSCQIASMNYILSTIFAVVAGESWDVGIASILFCWLFGRGVRKQVWQKALCLFAQRPKWIVLSKCLEMLSEWQCQKSKLNRNPLLARKNKWWCQDCFFLGAVFYLEFNHEDILHICMFLLGWVNHGKQPTRYTVHQCSTEHILVPLQSQWRSRCLTLFGLNFFFFQFFHMSTRLRKSSRNPVAYRQPCYLLLITVFYFWAKAHISPSKTLPAHHQSKWLQMLH